MQGADSQGNVSPRMKIFRAKRDGGCHSFCLPSTAAVRFPVRLTFSMHRSHHCAQITTADLGATVSLLGWVDTIRDQGGIIFVDLRDRKGVTQIQLEPHDNAKLGEQLKHLKPESVIGVTGKVVRRPAGTENKNLPTGEVEVNATALEIHNISDTPPFPLDDAGGDKVNEDLRFPAQWDPKLGIHVT